MRTCNNGALSGTNPFASCSVNAPTSCLFNNQTVPHGGQVQAYLYSNVTSGGVQTCDSQTRTCNNGNLSGSYNFASCSVNSPAPCLFNGQTIPHGGTVMAYFQQSVNNASLGIGGATCTTSSNLENRSCSNGSLSGSARYASCQNNFKDVRFGNFALKNLQVILSHGYIPLHPLTQMAAAYKTYQPAVFNYTGNSCSFVAYVNDSGVLKRALISTPIATESQKCGNPWMWTPIDFNYKVLSHPTINIVLDDGFVFGPTQPAPYRFYVP
jgi:hypothetical protein